MYERRRLAIAGGKGEPRWSDRFLQQVLEVVAYRQPGGIISERWAELSQNGRRHRFGMVAALSGIRRHFDITVVAGLDFGRGNKPLKRA